MKPSYRVGLKNLALILIANGVLGAAMPMLIILGGLSGMLLSTTPGLATLPPSVQMLAGLLGASPMSHFMGRFGRRPGFTLGATFLLAGGCIGTLSLVIDSFPLPLCIAHAFLGVALVCFGYFRFAAAEVVPKEWQSVAISLTLGSGLFAALVGPEIFLHSKDLLDQTPLAGAYLAIAAISLFGMVPVWLLPVSHPSIVSTGCRPSTQTVPRPTQRRLIYLAILSAVVAQGVMVMMMTPTPIAMIGQGYLERDASNVIRWHVIAMFAPSFMTGFLIRKFTAPIVMVVGFALLAAAAWIAIDDTSLPHFYFSLVFLGIGWNFGFIGATSLLSTVVPQHLKPRVQGINDTLMALSSTLMSFSAGVIIADGGWRWIGIAALPFLILALAALLTIWLRPFKAASVI